MAILASQAARRELNRLLLCLSLGNLMFVGRWYDQASTQSPALNYFRAGQPPPRDVLLLALISVCVIAGIVLRAGWWLIDRSNVPWRKAVIHCGFLLLLIDPVDRGRRQWNILNPAGDWVSVLLVATEVALVAGIFARFWGSMAMVRPARSVVLALSLLAPVALLDMGFRDPKTQPDVAFEPKRPLPMLPASPGPRFLWVLFDELDQRLAFEARPASVQLPELDRLRSESAIATQVQETEDRTILALPTLFVGHKLSRVQVVDASTLLLTEDEAGAFRVWGDYPSVFKRAQQLGVNTELVGWYHPYCRAIGDQLSRCFAVSAEQSLAIQTQTQTAKRGLVGSIRYLLQLHVERLARLFADNPETGWVPTQIEVLQQQQQRQYFTIRDHAYASARDPQIRFAFYHFPAPHMFPIYNRRARNFELNSSLDYLDNLALVDRTVGELRRTLEEQGLWDRTTLLISSDHALRPKLWRGTRGWSKDVEQLTAGGARHDVPFIVKLAGDSQPAVMDAPLSAVVTSDFAIAVLSGEITTNAQAAEWLRARAATNVSSAVPPPQ